MVGLEICGLPTRLGNQAKPHEHALAYELLFAPLDSPMVGVNGIPLWTWRIPVARHPPTAWSSNRDRLTTACRRSRSSREPPSYSPARTRNRCAERTHGRRPWMLVRPPCPP